MIKKHIYELVHRQIILDLTVRTLERDCKYFDFENLKLKSVFLNWFEENLKELKNELYNIKKQLGYEKVKIQDERKEDDFITIYTVVENMKVQDIRYSNVVLKNWVTEEVQKLLGMKYKTTEARLTKDHSS